MPELVKIPYEGEFANAEQVDVESPGPFSHILDLADGGKLKMDMRISQFFRLVDKKDETGEPIYVFNIQIKVVKVKDDALAKEQK